MAYLIDPRAGDAEDDASSTKKRPLLAIAGSMLAELSPAKFVFTWIVIVVLPALTIGMAPPIASAWLSKVSYRALAFSGAGSALVIAFLIALAWFGLRPMLRFAEANFWSLNSIAVQPCYALVREALRHFCENIFYAHAEEDTRARIRANLSVAAGVICAIAGGLVMLVVWQYTKWNANFGDFASPEKWLGPAIANATFAISGYFSLASFVWGLSDTLMDQPARILSFTDVGTVERRHRVVHVSDLHIVGEPFGFRIESGRAGPQGNGRVSEMLASINRIHTEASLDLILVTGDMTDAGRSGEWAAFFDALEAYPSLMERTLILPGNHDVNIVDRANPARLELPFSPQKRLRQLRLLSAMEHVQGRRAHVFDRKTRRIGATLSEMLAPHGGEFSALADNLSFWQARKLAPLWADCFPLVVPPAGPDDLGVILLNSNSDANFSFTNALGLVTADDVLAVCDILRSSPNTRWIIGLHHHLVEYPMLAKSFSERIGTSLVNGSWFLRQLKPFAHRIVLMHGHRHIDWIGHCGQLHIVSASSPVMEALNHQPTSFLIHSVACPSDGSIRLGPPQRVILEGVAAASPIDIAADGSPAGAPAN